MAITDPDLDESTYAADGSCSAGFDRPAIVGVRLILENCARVIQTPNGVNPDGSARGLFFDVQAGVRVPLQHLVNATPDDADLVRIGGEWGQACRSQIAGVTRARFTLSRSDDGKSIRFVGVIDIATGGTFALSGSAGDVIQVLVPEVAA